MEMAAIYDRTAWGGSAVPGDDDPGADSHAGGQIVNGVVGVILILLGYALYFYTFFRMFSRSWQAREKENRWFLSGWRPVCAWFRMRRTIWRDRKVYKYFRCPHCHDWQRAPRDRKSVV